MKHTIILAGLILAGLFTSCQDDFLEAPAKSTLEPSVIFSDPTLAKSAVDGIKIPFGDTNSYRGRYLPFYGFNTDTEWWNAGATLDDKSELCNYTTPADNKQMNSADNAWASMYSGIERANLCIDGLRTYGNPNPGTALGYLLGEALTLRAVYYADLVKTWGDVPFRFEPITSTTIYLPRSPRAEIYKQLLKDLEEASTLVPWPAETAATNSVERINKAFVKGLRARIALVAAGYQQYSDGIHRSKDPELSVEKMYKLALDECREVIASGKAQLEPTFEGLWKKYNQEVLTAGGESLWEIPFGDGRGRMLFSFAVRHTSAEDQYQANGANRGGTAGPLPFIFYDYDQADTRRDVTCVPYKWGTAAGTAKIAKQELGTIDTWYFGKYRYEWMKRKVTSSNDDGVNKIYMRYAEVLLMAAEAANEIESPAAAAPYLRQVRQRAFGSVDQSSYITRVSASKEDMFKAIVDENKYEFTGEMERKQALIRWNLLGKNLAESKLKLQSLRDRTGDYADVPTTLYYKYKDDETGKYPGTILVIYGLNKGETVDQTANGYDKITWVWPNISDATKDKSNFLYLGDPDTHQFWPIWQVFINQSNGMLSN